MNVTSLVVAIAAILISAAGVFYAKHSADSAKRAADAADRSVAAAEDSLSIEQHRRHEERRPKLSGEVNSRDGDHSYQLAVTLDASSCPLTALEVSIRPEQGVSLKRGFSGVEPVTDSAAMSLRAFAYDRTNRPAGVQPGETVSWLADLTHEYGNQVMIDAICHAEGKGEGEDKWTVLVVAPIVPRLLDTIG